MDKRPGFQMIGDYRDIPLALGLVVMSWNTCELRLRDIIRTISTRGRTDSEELTEILISEMGTLGLTQAIRCYVDEVPRDEPELAEALRHSADLVERLKAYRNYYTHGIHGVARYGFFVTDEAIEQDLPAHELFFEGPFASIYQKSAKGRTKFVMDFITAEKLTWLNNQLADAATYLSDVHSSFCHFLRRKNYRKSAPLPAPPPLPDVLVKPELRHPKMKQFPALMPRAQKRRLIAEQDKE